SWGLYYSGDGRLHFIVSQNGDNINRFADTVNPVSTLGVYRHVAATFTPSPQESMKIYIDGQEVPVTLSGSPVSSIFNSATNLRIGTVIFSEGMLANFFKGNIDEVQIHNRALTAAEIQTIYNAGSAGMCRPSYNGGVLDPTFGTGGRVITNVVGGDSAAALLVQADGKLVTGGGSGLARYNTNGTLDTSFGSNGRVTTDVYVNAIVLQPDGRII